MGAGQHRAFLIAREELVLFFCAAAILLYVSSVGIYYFENEAQPTAFASVFHSLWWAVITLTTVGYGDVYPITTGGRSRRLLRYREQLAGNVAPQRTVEHGAGAVGVEREHRFTFVRRAPARPRTGVVHLRVELELLATEGANGYYHGR